MSMSYLGSLSTHCPIDIGTSLAEEVAIWGSDAHAALLAAHKARETREQQLRLLAAPPPPEIVVPITPFVEPLRDHVEAANATLRAYHEAAKMIPISRIQRTCARYYGVTVGDIIGPRRPENIARPRQVGYYLARQLTSRSLPEIGRRFGGKDHSSVYVGIRKIEALIKADSGFAAEIDRLRRAIVESVWIDPKPINRPRRIYKLKGRGLAAQLLPLMQIHAMTGASIAEVLGISFLSANARIGNLVKSGKIERVVMDETKPLRKGRFGYMAVTVAVGDEA